MRANEQATFGPVNGSAATGPTSDVPGGESGCLRALFEAALEHPPEERAAWLGRACGGDPVLAARVERMVQADGTRHSLLDLSTLDLPNREVLPLSDTWSGDPISCDTAPPAGARHSAHQLFRPGEVFAGRFRIVELCGQGGMGQVYRAEDLEVAQPVALKFLTVSRAPEQRRRLRSEVRLARQISHPNVCRVYDIGEADGHLYVSMEYVRGEDLKTLLERRGLLTIDEGIRILRQLCAGLAAAHGKGIVHRDLKTGNIMIDPDGEVRIMDFGLATDGALHLGALDIRSGTPAYMAPEQLAGREATIRSDVYAFGLIAYELLTGAVPFQADSPHRLLHLREAGAARKPSSLVRDIPRRLDETVLRCLDPDPRKRPASAEAIPALLPDNALAAGAASAMALPPPRRRRKRGVAAVASALALGMAVTVLWRGGAVESTSTSPWSPNVQVQPLTLDGRAGLGAISPDGSLLVYQPYGELSVRVRRLADAVEFPLVGAGRFSRIGSVTVGPRSNFVDVVAVATGGSATDLWRIPLHGTPRLLIRDVVSAIGWAPDGGRMAYLQSASVDGGVRLVVADADGRHPRELATRRPPGMFYSDLTAAAGRPPSRPAWSPDARSIALAGYRLPAWGGATELVTIDVESGTERDIQPLAGSWSEVAWLDEARYVLIGGEHPHGFPTKQVWVSDRAGRHRTRVTREFGFFMNLTVTADRTTAVAKRFTRFSGIWVSDPSGRTPEVKVPLSVAGAAHPRLDAGGGLTYTALKPDGGAAVFHLRPGATGPLEVIGSAPPPMAVPFHDVSADGQTLVHAELAEPHGLIRTRNDGTLRVRLVDGDVAIPRITPDGATVLFTRNSAPGLYSVPTAGGAVRQLTDRAIPDGRIDRGFGAGFSISPNGRQVLLQTGKSGVLALCDLPDCTNARELPLPSLMWGPRGKGVTFFRDSATLLEQPLAGGPPRVLTTFDGDDRVIDLSWSPDGSRLATSRGWYPNDMVIIKGLR